MLIPNKFNGYHNGTRQLHISMGGGGGGGPTQTTSTVQNTNIPGYAQPYVESMLGGTIKQLFNTTETGGTAAVAPTYDSEGNQLTAGTAAIPGNINIDTFKPYQAYGGEYDALGNAKLGPDGKPIYDPTKGIAGFTPDQLAAQKGIMGLNVPAEYRTAGLGMESVYNDMKTNAYTAPTNLGYTADAAKAATAGASQNAVGQGYTATNAGSQGYTSRDATSQGYTSSDAAAIRAEAARLGVPPEAIAAQFKGPQDISSTNVSSGSPLTAFQMQAAQSQYAPAISQYGMAAAPNVSTKSFTDRGTAASYMSPYMQQVVDAQQQEAQRESDIAGQAQQAQAARSGAFGGSRDSIMRAEAARNLATQKGNIQAQGLQSAFQQAQQQFNAEQGIGLQGQVANQQAGLTVGQQNLGAQLGIQQLGVNTGLQVQLANLSNTQQAAVQNQASQLQAQGMSATQALQAALANQSSGLQAAQANQGMAFNTAAQNAQLAQQTALANQAMKGQYGLTQGQFDQAANAQTSSQAQNAALANAAAKSAASQFGASAANQAQLANAAAFNQAGQFGANAANTAALQNAAAASQASQFGAAAGNQASLANQAASNQMAQYNAGLGQQTALANQAAANQAAQFGAGQNLASAQTEAQYDLSGNALQLQAANQYAGLGQQQLAAQQGILGMQSTVGAQQQALDQAAKNQAVQDYANAQQYPLMQLGTMSNMLRGLPMQASTTNQYAASPNPLSQAVGTVGAGASIYNAMKPGAAGGLPSEFPTVKYAKGGITSIPRYDMGGEVESQLENMDEKGLQAQARESSSPSIRRMAQRLLRERQMSKPQGADAANVQYQAAQPQMPSYMPGGIVAFVTGGGANEEGGETEAKAADTSGRTMEDRLAMPPSSAPSGIMAAAPVTQVRPEPSPINVQPGGVVTPAMAQMQNRIIAQQATTQKDADRTVSERVAEKEALLGPNTGREDMRAQEMARRANTADEVSRQKSLRMAEFFAKWGSTPGPVLVAGMNALKESIPNIISDEKEAKKLQRESDKIIYDLDQATRLEKQGNIKDSTTDKNDAAKRAEDLNKTIAQIQERQMTAEASIKVGQLHKEGAVESAQIRAAQDKLNRAAQLSATNETKIYGQYQAATKEYDNVLASVARQESQDTHKLDLKNLATYAMSAADKKTGKINPEKIPAQYKVPYAETSKRVEARKQAWETAIEEAKKDKDLAFSRVKGLSSEAVEARVGKKSSPSDRPSLDDPSLQK